MAEQPSTSSALPAPRPPQRRERVEYYKEESFQGLDLTRDVHLGWGALGGEELGRQPRTCAAVPVYLCGARSPAPFICAGTAIILFCMGMSAATQVRGRAGACFRPVGFHADAACAAVRLERRARCSPVTLGLQP
jgi:hypothetical protein